MFRVFLCCCVFVVNGVSAQDSQQYIELTDRKTETFHANGNRSHRYIKSFDHKLKVKQWNENGDLVRKSTSRRSIFKKIPRSRQLRLIYNSDLALQQITYTSTKGCMHIKQRWRIDFNQKKALPK